MGKRGRDNKMMKSVTLNQYHKLDREAGMFTYSKIRSRAVELKVNSAAMKGGITLNNWATKADPIQLIA